MDIVKIMNILNLVFFSKKNQCDPLLEVIEDSLKIGQTNIQTLLKKEKWKAFP